MYDERHVDQSQFNMGIDITQRLSLWLRRADDQFLFRNPEQIKLCYDNVYRMVCIYLKDMTPEFQFRLRQLRGVIDRDVSNLNVLRNRISEYKQTLDKNYYEIMIDILMKELEEYDLLLTEIRQAKGLNLPDKSDPGKAMLNVGGR